MKDEQIIKALECCTTDNCKECPLRNVIRSRGCAKLWTNALRLIKRQESAQSAIDKFARDLCEERMIKGKAIADFEDLQDYIKKEKTEAIREFAEKLKQEDFDRCIDVVYDGSGEVKRVEIRRVLFNEQIDNLAKEMVEEAEK